MNTKRLMKWLAFNGTLAAMLGGSIYFDNEGILQLTIMILWFLSGVKTLLFFSSDTREQTIVKLSEEDSDEMSPAWLNLSYGMLFTVALAYLGYPILAFVTILGVLGEKKLRMDYEQFNKLEDTKDIGGNASE